MLNKFGTLSRVLRTVQHLRSEQIIGQIRVRLQRYIESPAGFKSQVKDIGLGSDLGNDWLCPVAQLPDSQDIALGNWTFLNHTIALGPIPNWSRTDFPKLWLYNLHYHEFLWGMEFEQGQELVHNYIEHYALARRRCGWESYPLSLRIMAWGAWFYGVHREKTLLLTKFDKQLRAEMQRMGSWLAAHMETHLGANHVLENALALGFLSGIFAGECVEEYASVSVRYLSSELPEQVLNDGAHYERSPMYQQRMLIACSWTLHAARISDDKIIEKLLIERVARMASWLTKMTHPDGDIALFQDAAVGIYPKPSLIIAWLLRMKLIDVVPILETVAPVVKSESSFSESSYAVGRNEMGDCLFVDFGGITPVYQPAHAHAAWGTFEFSVADKRLVVDAGVYDYLPSRERALSRSTAAHSTIEVSGQDQAEMWGAFRVGRRGQPFDVVWTESENGFTLCGKHTAYMHLGGKPIIARNFSWNGVDRQLMIEDWLEQGAGIDAVARLWLDPSWTLEQQVSGVWVATCDGRRVMITVAGSREIEGEAYINFGEKRVVRGLLASVELGQKLQWCLQLEDS